MPEDNGTASGNDELAQARAEAHFWRSQYLEQHAHYSKTIAALSAPTMLESALRQMMANQSAPAAAPEENGSAVDSSVSG
jgi:hypothetical protein